jgi:8-oxo-dGTP pyrophosphatase MutT (NUDIX family)
VRRQLQVANIVVINPAGEALILRRSKTHPTLAFHKDLPGGMVDVGENTLGAAVRELLEETGIVVNPEDVEHVYAGEHQDVFTVIHRTLYKIHLQEHVDVTISWEHDQYSWQPIETLATFEDYAQEFYKIALGYLLANKTIRS